MLALRTILVARDFSPPSDRALGYAIDLARRTSSTLHLVYAQVALNTPFVPAYPDRSAELEDRIRERLLQDIDGTPLPDKYPQIDMIGHVARDAAAAPAILNYAAHQNIDLIVLGTRGRRGVRRALLGSCAEEVVRLADPPVLTVHPGDEPVRTAPPPPIHRILVPIDFSEHARDALRHAHAMARLYDAALDLLHVIEPHLHPAFYEEGLDASYEVMKERKAKHELRTFYETTLRPASGALSTSPDASTMNVHVTAGRPASEIIRFAGAHGSDLVVMSTHGLTGLKRFMMGSVAEKVVRHVALPILTVKAFGRPLVDPASPEPPDTNR